MAIIRSPHRSGRPITEILHDAKQRKCNVGLDEDFGKDLEEIVESRIVPNAAPRVARQRAKSKTGYDRKHGAERRTAVERK